MLFSYKAITKSGEERTGNIDAVNEDVAISSLQRRDLGQPPDAVLAGRVGAGAGAHALGRDAADVDDAPSPLALHDAEGGPRAEEGGAQVDGDHVVPILDAEGPSILHKISEHGGYAYVGMSALAAAGDVRAAEAAREMAWEQLHSGPWNSVLPIWRDAYSMACLHVARVHLAGGEFSEALRVLDMGLIMGGLALRKDLESAIEKASAMARKLTVLEGGGEGFAQAQRLLVPQQFNIAEVRWFRLYPWSHCLGRLLRNGRLYHWRISSVTISGQVLQL
mgnify:CR=1 FL=1